MIYIIVQSLAILTAWTLPYFRPFARKSTFLLIMIIFGWLAINRGMVGTDTYTYTSIMLQLEDGYDVGVEPGFKFYFSIISRFISGSSVQLNSYAALYFFLIICYVLRADKVELAYIAAYYAPQYFIMYSMNGIRIGIASAFFLLAHQSVQRNKAMSASFLFILSVLFHYTIIAAIIILLFFLANSNKKMISFYRILAAAIIISGAILLSDYLNFQKVRYSDSLILSATAGLSIVIKMSIFLFLFTKFNRTGQGKQSTLYHSLFLILFSYVVTQFSYAGLRFLDILCWLIPLLFMLSFSKVQLGNRFERLLWIVGAIGAVGVTINILGSVGPEFSPFIPYSTLDETGVLAP